MLALNRAGVSQREIAIARWGLERVEKEWDADGWMRAQVRYRLDKAREIERARERAAAGAGEGGGGD